VERSRLSVGEVVPPTASRSVAIFGLRNDGQLSRRALLRGVAATAVGLLLLAGLFLGGHAIGASGGEDLDLAREDGRRVGTERGTRAGERAGYEIGLARGRKLGYRAAYRPAFRRGRRAGTKQVDDLGPVPASGQPTACGPGLVSATNGCVPEGAARCAAYQDFVPGQGCVPPLAPGEIEASPQCPPGQVPVGVTGACARP
jgi:hypothetical protein